MDGEPKARPERGLENFLASLPRYAPGTLARSNTQAIGRVVLQLVSRASLYEMRCPTIDFGASSIGPRQYLKVPTYTANKLKFEVFSKALSADRPIALAVHPKWPGRRKQGRGLFRSCHALDDYLAENRCDLILPLEIALTLPVFVKLGA
jgi:hypothetical protein